MAITLHRDIERREGWEMRLAHVIVGATHHAYKLGEHDCFRLALAAVEALTCVDLWPDWQGRYSTRLQSLRLLLDFAGPAPDDDHNPFSRAFTRLFGVETSGMAYARRGDIAEYIDADGQQHLGVVTGTRVAVLGEHRLLTVRLDECAHCWRIG